MHIITRGAGHRIGWASRQYRGTESYPQLQEFTQYPRGAIAVTFCIPNLQHLPMDACKQAAWRQGRESICGLMAGSAGSRHFRVG